MRTRQEIDKNVNISIEFRFWYIVGPISHQTVHTNFHTFNLSTRPGQRYPTISIQCLGFFVIILYTMHVKYLMKILL